MPDRYAYYQWSQEQVQVRDRTFTFCTRPALGEWRERAAATLLLAERMDLSPRAQVLHVHCDRGLVAAAAAHIAHEGRIIVLDSSSVAIEAAGCSLRANEVANAETMISDCAQAVHGRTFDTVLALLPKGRATWEQTILDAATVLRPKGDLYLAGANNAGIKTAAKFIASVFGDVSVLTYRGGSRVLRAVKGTETILPSSDYYTWRPVSAEVYGEQIRYVTKPGLFSWEQLDDGTRLLVEVLQEHRLRPDDQVLDVGCGSGVLTLLSARQARHGSVVGVDVDCRAVEATRRTLALNEISNAQVLLSDCGQAVQDRTFSVIVTNPPFHREQATTYAIAAQIIGDASHLLQRRGRLYLVANSFLKYRPLIEGAFGNVELLRRTNRFNVWHAVKRH